MALQHFLILYSLRDGELVRMHEFGSNVERATEAYSELEHEYRHREDNEDFEIVLVGADSLDTVHHTHSRYFEREREVVPF